MDALLCTYYHSMYWKKLVKHGAQVIHLHKPKWDQASDNISWEVGTPGVWNIDEDNVITKSAVFVTTYDQLRDNPKI